MRKQKSKTWRFFHILTKKMLKAELILIILLWGIWKMDSQRVEDIKMDISLVHARIQEPEKKKTIQEQVWDMLDGYGLTFKEKIEAAAIIQCESRWDPFAIGVNKDGNKDLGLWQTSEKHQKITRGCAFDYVCQTKYVIENIYLKQKNFSAWVCSRNNL